MPFRTSPTGIALLHDWEKCVLTAYDDNGGLPGGTWTIGWGTTRYPTWHQNGRRVLRYDTCTQAQADLFFAEHLHATEDAVDALTTDGLTQRQFDALVAFSYNVGIPAYQSSTLRRWVNVDANDPNIRGQFMRWVYETRDGVKVKVPGLRNRRQAEADLYFGVTP